MIGQHLSMISGATAPDWIRASPQDPTLPASRARDRGDLQVLLGQLPVTGCPGQQGTRGVDEQSHPTAEIDRRSGRLAARPRAKVIDLTGYLELT